MTHRCSSRRSSLEELPKMQYPIKGISMCQGQEIAGENSQILIRKTSQKEQSALKEQKQQQQYQSFSTFRSISRDHQDNNININHRSNPSTEYLQQSQHQSSSHSSLKKSVPIIRRFSSTGLPPPVELQYQQQQQLPEQSRFSSQNINIIANTQISRKNEHNQHNQYTYQTTSQQQPYYQQNQQLQLNQSNPIDYLTARDTKLSNNHLLMDQAMTVRMDINGGKKFRSFSQTAITTATPFLEQYKQQSPLILLHDICTPHSDSVKPQLNQYIIQRQIPQQTTQLIEQQQHHQGVQPKQQQIQILYNSNLCSNTADLPLFSKTTNHNKSIYQIHDIISNCNSNNNSNNIPNPIQTIPCNNISISQNDRPISTIASHDDISHSCEIPQLDLHRIPSFSFFPQETTKRSKKDDRDEGDILEVYQYKRQSRRSSYSQLFIPPSNDSTSLMQSQNLLLLQDNNTKKLISEDSTCSAQSIGDTTATINRITNHSRLRQNHELLDNNPECSQQEQYEHVILPTTEGSVQEQSESLSSYEREVLSPSEEDDKDICVPNEIISRFERQKKQDNQYDQEFKQVRDNLNNIINNKSNIKIIAEKENINDTSTGVQCSNSHTSSSSKNTNNHLSNVQRLMGQIKRIPVMGNITSNRDINQEQIIQKQQQQQQSQPTAVEQLYSKLQSLNNSYLRLSSQIQESIKQQIQNP